MVGRPQSMNSSDVISDLLSSFVDLGLARRSKALWSASAEIQTLVWAVTLFAEPSILWTVCRTVDNY